MKCLPAALIAAVLAGSASAGTPGAACPAQELGLGMVQNFGTHRRWSELCGVPEADIVRLVDSSVKLMEVCLRGQHVPPGTIASSLANGRTLGDQAYVAQPDKAGFCLRIKNSYTRGK